MPRNRVAMHNIKEVMRLHHKLGHSQREIARSCGISLSTVNTVLQRARQVGLSWPLEPELEEEALEQRLYGQRGVEGKAARRETVDFAEVQKQLQKHKHTTLLLLWQEYREVHPHGYSYSHYCQLYRQWRQNSQLVMRQEHIAGDKLFVDYAGQTLPITDPKTGTTLQAQLFVAVLGASSYLYVEASRGQDLPNWIASHVRALQHIGGAVNVLVPDNLKSAVKLAHLYGADLNRSYMEMARHYGMSVIPARPRRPKDKGCVENGVLLTERRILAVLRHRQFESLGEANKAIWELLDQINHKPFQKMPGSRASLFEELDRAALRALPTQPYEYCEWRKAKVNIDYHVVVDSHYYSAPYRLVGKTMQVRLTANCVELFDRGQRVAAHVRSQDKGRSTTQHEHRPKSHREHLKWSPERIKQWAHTTGPCTGQLISDLLDATRYPREHYRSYLGIIRLGKSYGPERMENAARRALHYGHCTYKNIKGMLASGVDRLPLEGKQFEQPPVEHENIRGSSYFKSVPTAPLQEVPSC